MRPYLLAALLAAVSGPAFAQAAGDSAPVATTAAPPAAATPARAPAPLPTPPRAFALAGYTEPVIPATSCKNIDAGQTSCLIPAMTAGRYLVAATVTSTATAADPAQEVVLAAGDQSCRIAYKPGPGAPWPVGTKHTFRAGCLFAVVTDTPVVVTAAYFDHAATKDAAGPGLVVIPQPWSGVLNALALTFPTPGGPPQAAAQTPADTPAPAHHRKK
jgi:hypothetical protein